MENFEVIKLQRSRDFSRKVNATFEFLKQNFGPLFKSIVVISGPSILLVCVLFGSVIGDFFSIFLNASTNPEIAETYVKSVSFWLQVILGCVFMLVGTVMTISVLNNYMILYDEKKTNKIEVSDVWERVRSSFWMYMGTTVLFYLLLMVVFSILGVFMFLVTQISPVLGVLGVFVFYAGVIYSFIGASLTFFVRSYEKKGFFASLTRSFQLVYGKWWSTFGIAFITYMVSSTISSLIFIPYYFYMLVKMMHSMDGGGTPDFGGAFEWITIVFFFVYYSVTVIVSALPNIGLVFQYFNLVELKEARGLISDIESVGQPSVVRQEDEQY